MASATAVSRAENGTDPVKAVSVVSTGTVEIHPEQPYGTRKPLYWWLLTSRRWTPPRPINAYVIEHARGLLLFDTGQDRASVTDASYFPGGVTGFLYDRLARFHIGEEETLTAQLATLGYAPTEVDTAILSHLHEDHIGGLPELGGADLLVAEAEWAELSKPAPEPRGFLRKHIQIPGLKWQQVDLRPTADPSLAPFTRSLDVMGDGSLVLVPTPGHTAGSMSLLIRRRKRSPLLLVGELPARADRRRDQADQRRGPGVLGSAGAGGAAGDLPRQECGGGQPRRTQAGPRRGWPTWCRMTSGSVGAQRTGWLCRSPAAQAMCSTSRPPITISTRTPPSTSS